MYDKANIIREYKESGDINNMLAKNYLFFLKSSKSSSIAATSSSE
jgi:hypothetical protein